MERHTIPSSLRIQSEHCSQFFSRQNHSPLLLPILSSPLPTIYSFTLPLSDQRVSVFLFLFTFLHPSGFTTRLKLFFKDRTLQFSRSRGLFVWSKFDSLHSSLCCKKKKSDTRGRGKWGWMVSGSLHLLTELKGVQFYSLVQL